MSCIETYRSNKRNREINDTQSWIRCICQWFNLMYYQRTYRLGSGENL